MESEKIQNEKFLPTVGIEPTTLRFEPDAPPTEQPGLDESSPLKVTFIHT